MNDERLLYSERAEQALRILNILRGSDGFTAIRYSDRWEVFDDELAEQGRKVHGKTLVDALAQFAQIVEAHHGSEK